MRMKINQSKEGTLSIQSGLGKVQSLLQDHQKLQEGFSSKQIEGISRKSLLVEFLIPNRKERK